MSGDAMGTTVSFALEKESTGHNTRATRTWRRNQKACVICHKRKVRCDFSEGAGSCTNCRAQDLECLAHERIRRHYSVRSSSPVPRHLQQRRSTTNQAGWPEPTPTSPPNTTEGFVRLTCEGSSDTGSPQPVLRRPTSVGEETNSPANSMSFIGRPEYLLGEYAVNESIGREVPPASSKSEISLASLRLHKAFDVPPRAIRDSLINNFITYCAPWMPIVEADELKQLGLDATESIRDTGSSLLLAQALFVAGSRVQSSRISFASCSDFYNRAKALFFTEHEPNPLNVIRALCLLQWYSPSGPEFVSIHSSGFWLSVAVGLAFQLGLHREPDPRWADGKLRRRVFWTLFSRDCLLSTAHGRPAAINLDDCDIRWPNTSDFPENNKQARLFSSYVDVCSILGRLGQTTLPGGHLRSSRLHIARELYRWISQLPPDLQLNSTAPYDAEVRQLHLPFFTALEILYSPGPSTYRCSAAAVLAASCVARIFEDFLARDELRHLSAYATFHLHMAALPQLSCHKIPGLWERSKAEFNVIRCSLVELKEKWHSARRTLTILDRLLSLVSRGDRASESSAQLDTSPDQLSYFEKIGPELCPKWDLIVSGVHATQSESSLSAEAALPIIWPMPSVSEQRIPLPPPATGNWLGISAPSGAANTGPAARGALQQLRPPDDIDLSNKLDWEFGGMADLDDNFDTMLGLENSSVLQGWEANLL